MFFLISFIYSLAILLMLTKNRFISGLLGQASAQIPFWKKGAVYGAVFVFLFGCTVNHEPMNDADRAERALSSFERIFPQEQLVIAEPLSMEQAMARALKYNLDARVKIQEQKLAEANLKVSQLEMLPDFNMEAALVARNEVAGSRSEEIETGIQNLNFSRSSEDTSQTYKLDLTYDLIELGINYIRAQQEAKRVEITKERRRAVLQNLMHDARVAYMRAAVAQMLEGDVFALKIKAEKALERAKEAMDSGLTEPVENLSYRKSLLNVIAELDTLLSKFTAAKLELSTLVNVRPGTDFELQLPDISFADAPTVRATIDQMEVFALLNRPELVEEDYQYEIEKQERESFWISLLPAIEPSLALNYDNNQFLLHNSWVTLGTRVAYNLFDLLTSEPRQEQIEEKLTFAAARRDALTLAVLGQVNLAYLRHKESLEALDLGERLYKTSSELSENMENYLSSGQTTEQQVVLTQIRELLARVEYYADFIEAQSTLAQLVLSLGYDAVPFEPQHHDADTLALYIERHNARLLADLKSKENLEKIKTLDPEDKKITMTAVHYTKTGRPWLTRTGPFRRQEEALKAAKGIMKVFEKQAAGAGYLPPVPYMRLEGEHLADYRYYLAFDNLQGLNKKKFCDIVMSSGHVCEQNHEDYSHLINQGPEIWEGNK